MGFELNGVNSDNTNLLRGEEFPVGDRVMVDGNRFLGPPQRAFFGNYSSANLWRGIFGDGGFDEGNTKGIDQMPKPGEFVKGNDFMSLLRQMLEYFRRPRPRFDLFAPFTTPVSNDPIQRAMDELKTGGMPGSRTVKVGKKKYRVTMDANGQFTVKRKKGFWGKVGGMFRKVAPFAALALNVIPGLGNIASGFLSKAIGLVTKASGTLGKVLDGALRFLGVSNGQISSGSILAKFLGKLGLNSSNMPTLFSSNNQN